MINKLNVSNIFNNKMIINKEEIELLKKTEDYYGARGEYFFNKKTIKYEQHYNDKYKLDSNSVYDCVECEGQTIDNININGKKLVIISTAVWGSYPEVIEIVTKSGIKEKKEIYFKDWYFGETNWSQDNYVNNIFATGRDIETNSNHYIYINEIDIIELGEIKKIILPYNPDIIIFGVYIEN